MITEQHSVRSPSISISFKKLNASLPHEFYKDMWLKLKKTIHEIQDKNNQELKNRREFMYDREELYDGIHNLCIYNHEHQLLSDVKKEFDIHIGKMVEAINNYVSLSPDAFLEHIRYNWNNLCGQLQEISKIFLYLDRTFVITSHEKSLFKMGLSLFRSHLCENKTVEKKLVKSVLQTIAIDRENPESIDQNLLKEIIMMLTDIGMYERNFEQEFLIETNDYYAHLSEEMMNALDVPGYLKFCEKRLEEEQKRCKMYLNSQTYKALNEAIEEKLLKKHMYKLLINGFSSIMDADRYEDLSRLHVLSNRIGYLERLKERFCEYVLEKGDSIVKDEEKEKEMILKLLKLKNKVDKILRKSFGTTTSSSSNINNNNNTQTKVEGEIEKKSSPFVQGVKDAFEKFINEKQNKAAELMAKFVDMKLSTTSKQTQNEEDLERILDDIMTLFRFIHGKDAFEVFYKRHLSKRLLMSRSASIDAEKSMISKLKEECGPQYTNKIEGMFKDMDTSKDIMQEFNASEMYRKAMGPEDAKMSVHILTIGNWPSYSYVDARLPDELLRQQNIFQEFFLSKRPGRQLKWYNKLGFCTVRAQFNIGNKELELSIYQTIVLLLYNNCDELKFRDIKELVLLPRDELVHVLLSFCFGKAKVLIKGSDGSSDVSDDDVFKFNADMAHQAVKIKLNSFNSKLTEYENEKTREAINHDRQHQIDAAIVRIMKTKQSLSHQNLLQELAKYVNFSFDLPFVKRRIESLMEREFIERSASDPNKYNYLA